MFLIRKILRKHLHRFALDPDRIGKKSSVWGPGGAGTVFIKNASVTGTEKHLRLFFPTRTGQPRWVQFTEKAINSLFGFLRMYAAERASLSLHLKGAA